MIRIRFKTINYVPTFRGKHNEVKSKCLLLLYNRYLDNQKGFKLAELVKMGGFNYKSLSVLLSRWIKWQYIGYRNCPGGREYRIRKRGRDWLESWQDIMPLERYISELENIQDELKSDGPKLCKANVY